MQGNAHINGEFTASNMTFSYTEQEQEANGQNSNINGNNFGSNTQPIYWYGGAPKAMSYVPERLYYSVQAANNEQYSYSFEATNHFASTTQLGINVFSINGATGMPSGHTNTTLYVNGLSYFSDAMTIANNLTINGNIIPLNASAPIWTLGKGTNPSDANDTPARWAGVFIGSYDTYGGQLESEQDPLIHNSIKPIYWNNGVPTEFTVSVGNSVHPVYLSNGTFIASSATVGSEISPIYMHAGALTVTDAEVGDPFTPIFLGTSPNATSSNNYIEIQ